MTLKQRAIAQTAAIVGAILVGSVAISLILAELTREQIVNGFAILSIAALVYAVYGVVLSRLEYNDTVKRLVDKQ